MTARVRILPSRHEFTAEGNDTILDAALRSGLALDYGCSNGNCGLCKAHVVSGETSKLRPHDYRITEAEKTANTVLMCSYGPVSDLVLEALEAHGTRDIPRQKVATRVRSKEQLTEDILLLRLQTPRTQRLRVLAGQSVTLSTNGAAREYPIASCPCDDRNLEFHVRRTNEPFSEHVFGRVRCNDVVNLEGPRGDFVLDESSKRPLLFLGYDTGFAPVKSLIEHAMALDTAESLNLYWAARTDGGHYLRNLCRSWCDALDKFHCALLTGAPDDPGLLQPLAREQPSLAACDVYVAGPHEFVLASEMFLLEHGLPQAQLRTSRVE